MNKKLKNLPEWAKGYIAGLTAVVLLVGIVAYAGGFTQSITVEGDLVQNATGGEESMFGGNVHNVPYDFIEGIEVDGNAVINGIGHWIEDDGNVEVGDFRLDLIASVATTSDCWLNNEGESGDYIYVYDAFINPDNTGTTTVDVKIGTSSVAYISLERGANEAGGSCSAGNAASTDCDAPTAAVASIMGNYTNIIQITGGTTATTTSFFKMDYQGEDTRDGSGTRYNVPVLYGEYVCLSASSTDGNTNNTDLTGAKRLFDVHAVLKFFSIKD